MKATGIVRRIDDLGRIVVPKEIRRTLRIKEGDSLEIFTESDGSIIFRKYSPIGEMPQRTEKYAEIISKISRKAVLITDRDEVVASFGICKKDFQQRKISRALDELMTEHKSYEAKGESPIKAIEGGDAEVSAAFPIIAGGDVCGCILTLSLKPGTAPEKSEVGLLEAGAMFLGCAAE